MLRGSCPPPCHICARKAGVASPHILPPTNVEYFPLVLVACCCSSPIGGAGCRTSNIACVRPNDTPATLPPAAALAPACDGAVARTQPTLHKTHL
eukprot:6214177-Pleurochrysis_carterae.AAC.2